MTDVTDPQARQLIQQALRIKAGLRTPEQERHRAEVDARNALIQKGVRAPASGVFGGKKGRDK